MNSDIKKNQIDQKNQRMAFKLNNLKFPLYFKGFKFEFIHIERSIRMKISKLSSMLLLILLLAFIGSIESSIPTIALENSVLNANTNYIMSYYNFRPFQTSSFFQIDFTQSDITVTDGLLNVTATLNSTTVSQSLIQANCTSRICTIKLGTSFAENTNVVMSFGQFRNPKYTAAQKITVFVYFGLNSNETQSVSISASAYLPMPVIVNSITQSDFGVGSQDVTYTMNVSFSYVPKDPEISIQIPPEIAYINLDTELSFYGTIQNIYPFSTINMLIFSLKSDEILNPKGFMLLTLHGFRNPRYIGTSTSFNVSMVQKRTATSSNCATCRVAYLYANSSKLLTVSSTTPGDITMNIFNPSSYSVSERINLTIGIKIVAPIPDGGKFRVILPPSITPILPVVCEAVYGFTVSNPAYCVYNQTANTIETVNFSIPYLEQTGDAILKIAIINPKDNRQTQFNFETLDELNRKIGKNRDPFLYTAVPKTLNTTVTKNTTFLESSFTLSSSLVLGQTLSPTDDSLLVTLPPSEFYNLSAIQCIASSLTIPCTKSIQNFTNNLLIQFAPPCSVCNISSSISFKINNLINPSFINDDMKVVGIQTMTNFGVIETFTGSIDLKEKDLVINQLNWVGSQQVGSDYKLVLNYELPRYIQKYGGYLVINYDQNSSFVNVAVNGTLFTYPQSLNALNENNQSLSNVISYWEGSTIKSLKQVKMKLCSNDSACGSNITISQLRKAFFPLTSASMTFKGQTLNGQAIATSLKDVSAFMPQTVASTSNVASTIPTTNTVSNYVFKLKLNRLPFDSGLRVDLTSKHEIQSSGRCFVEVNPSTLLGFGIDCQVTNTTSVLLTYSGDNTLMTTSQIEYTLTIVNVLNPPSIMPITYKIDTFFNSIKTGTYSTSYALTQPYTLSSDLLTTLNSTYGQNTVLSIRLRPGYYAFDEMRMSIPKENFKAFTSFNGLSSTNGSFKLTENSTHFNIEKIYTLPNTFTIELSNALNTSASSKILAEMYVQGYLSSRGLLDLPRITPVYLYATASSSNRYVGESTTLTFDVRRVNSYAQQKYMKIYFNNTVFSMPTSSNLFTSDQLTPQVYSYQEDLTAWSGVSKSIVLQSFQNMKFVPKNQTLQALPQINISTFDQNNSIVATTLVNLFDIVSNKTKDSVSYTFTRTNVESLNNTDIIVEFVPRYPEMAKLLKIELPVNENRLQTDSSCVIGDGSAANACQIVDKLWNTFTIQYPTTSTKIILKNIWNMFPSDNNLTLSLMTQESQPIEQSSKPILPAIDLDLLDIKGTANTSSVGSPVQLQFMISSPQNYIEVGSKVKFIMPDKIYSRQMFLISKDCEYEISGTRYSGCQYETDMINDSKEWIQYITVSNFGQMQLMPATGVKLILYLMNPWTAYPFEQKNITAIQFNSMNQQVAKGSILLNSIYPNVTAFTPATLQYYSFMETNKQCNGENLFNLTITVPITIAAQTYLYILLPTAYFSWVSNQAGYEIESQTASTIKIRKLISECVSFPASTGLCAKADESLTFVVKVNNEKYFKTIDPKPKLGFYLMNDNSSVSSQVDVALSDRIPNSLQGMTLQRNSVTLSSNTMNTLKFTLPNGFNTSKPIKLSITPLTSPIGFMKSIQSYKFASTAQITTSPTVSSSMNGKQMTLISSSLPSTSVEIQLTGVNPSYVPNVENESYIVKIYDDSYIYFSTMVNITQENRLKPISEGIEIKRSNSLVNTMATYTISGSLPNGVDFGRLVFNYTTSISAASLTDFKNMRLGDFVNPMSSNIDTYESVSILNDTHILFSNNRIKTTPSLISLALPPNAVSSVQYNTQMRINTEETLAIAFSSLIPGVEKINLKIPTIFKLVKSVKVNSQQITSYKVSSINSTHSLIEIPVSSPASKIELTFMTLEEQRIFTNSTFTIETQYPTQSYQHLMSLNIFGTSLPTNLKMSSTKVNEENRIQLQVTPLNKLNTSLIVYLPTFLNNQLQNLSGNQSVIRLTQNSAKKTFNLQFSTTSNGYFFEYPLELSSPTSPLTLTLDTVTNPSSNQPFYFIIQQQQLTSSKPIIGHSSVQILMTTLELIYVRSAQRNTSKIGVPVEIQTQIQIPANLKQSVVNALVEEECVIQMPSVQVVRLSQDSECEVYLLGQSGGDQKLSCKMHPTLNSSIITSCKAGLNRYSIRKGFKNMLYSIIPNATQKPFVYIGQPYLMAQSEVTSTSFLSPIVTSGSLSLNTLTSSSSVRLQKTTLSLNMTLENIQQVDCVNFKFERENYIYSNSDLKCKSNGKSAECWSSETGSVMVNVTSISSNNLHIEIEGLVNYLRQGNFTIRTLKYLSQATSTTPQNVRSSDPNSTPKASSPISIQSAPDSAFGLIDIFYSSLNDIGATFTSNTYRTRVINPENYVSDEAKKIEIIFDDEASLPSVLDKTQLNFNVTTNVPNCQLTNSEFASSLILSCKFTQSMDFNLNVKLFHKDYTDIELSSTQFSSYIYPTPSSNCQNQMCDLCSTGPTGQEKCFSCRQNYYEFQNRCIETCPTGFTSYPQYMTCEQCSSNCQSCFGLYDNNCLQCQNSTLVSQNGLCVESCSSGYPENGYCIGDNQCFDQGCRTCSATGFCYQCLPDYSGEPTCKWQQLLPPILMSFFAAPFAVYALVSTVVFLFLKGVITMTYQVIFSFSLLEYMSWIFIVPALHTKEEALLLISMIILRIVLGIVAYETYYKKQINSHIGINEEESLLEKEKSSQKENESSKNPDGPVHFDEDWKSRVIRFLAHTNGVDSYEAFKVFFSTQLRIEHNDLYLWISTANRILVCAFMFYVLSQTARGDLIILPLATLLSSLIVMSLRAVKSKKFQECWHKVRGSGK